MAGTGRRSTRSVRTPRSSTGSNRGSLGRSSTGHGSNGQGGIGNISGVTSSGRKTGINNTNNHSNVGFGSGGFGYNNSGSGGTSTTELGQTIGGGTFFHNNGTGGGGGSGSGSIANNTNFNPYAVTHSNVSMSRKPVQKWIEIEKEIIPGFIVPTYVPISTLNHEELAVALVRQTKKETYIYNQFSTKMLYNDPPLVVVSPKNVSVHEKVAETTVTTRNEVIEGTTTSTTTIQEETCAQSSCGLVVVVEVMKLDEIEKKNLLPVEIHHEGFTTKEECIEVFTQTASSIDQSVFSSDMFQQDVQISKEMETERVVTTQPPPNNDDDDDDTENKKGTTVESVDIPQKEDHNLLPDSTKMMMTSNVVVVKLKDDCETQVSFDNKTTYDDDDTTNLHGSSPLVDPDELNVKGKNLVADEKNPGDPIVDDIVQDHTNDTRSLIVGGTDTTITNHIEVNDDILEKEEESTEQQHNHESRIDAIKDTTLDSYDERQQQQQQLETNDDVDPLDERNVEKMNLVADPCFMNATIQNHTDGNVPSIGTDTTTTTKIQVTNENVPEEEERMEHFIEQQNHQNQIQAAMENTTDIIDDSFDEQQQHEGDVDDVPPSKRQKREE